MFVIPVATRFLWWCHNISSVSIMPHPPLFFRTGRELLTHPAPSYHVSPGTHQKQPNPGGIGLQRIRRKKMKRFNARVPKSDAARPTPDLPQFPHPHDCRHSDATDVGECLSRFYANLTQQAFTVNMELATLSGS
jgi:hypothetical protein